MPKVELITHEETADLFQDHQVLEWSEDKSLPPQFGALMGFATRDVDWGQSSPYIKWLRLIAHEVGGRSFEFPLPPLCKDFQVVRQRMLDQFAKDLVEMDEDPTRTDVRVMLWVANLSVYRIYRIAQAVEKASLEAMRWRLTAIADKCESSTLEVMQAANKVLLKHCAALWDEFQAQQG